ncbi:FecCD family ABC transporter permease [Corynebacterium epidermidicanis]|uniref:ABC-type Fe3+-siderophore transport system, permease component n=1 Tax=Corynebacterium epidermidicanis TaxID=1050174 RepID=A0A0G3GZQ4_9CORY|nr:iron ABC transporter permease [Corynebacterium epidermidicanis]AKK04322.1 ABC-type Fe3+-siderophore transport system, permease component [Corynebacterium epidermidicanis]
MNEVVTALSASRRRAVSVAICLAAILLISLVAAIMAGPVDISASQVWHVLRSGGDTSTPHATIIWALRTPRALLAAAVGAGLALAGVILQALVRNVLADPYIIGVNSGASCGAAIAITMGASAGLGLQGSAFVGAALASALVFAIARGVGRMTSTRLLMAGVAVGYALSALTSFLVFAADTAEASRSVMFWLLGSLGLAAWGPQLTATGVVVVLAATLTAGLGPRIDALASGDETALTLGINPDRLRAGLLAVVCVVVGTVVAMAGSIGFIGLVIPHLARRLVGSAHRFVVPVAALLGAILLLWADVVARVVLAPQEVPIGIITAIVGAPFLLLLVRKMHA